MNIKGIEFHDKDNNSIEKDYSKYAMIINSMLSRGFYSDALFDRAFIDVTVQFQNDLDNAFYRLLWEDSYLKIVNPVTTVISNDTLRIGITISEAISFIFKATPPRLKNQIIESHKSIKDIIATLNTFLMEGGDYINYRSLFYDHIRLKHFGTTIENFEDIYKGAKTLMNRATKTNMVGYVYNSALPFKDIFGSGSSYYNNSMVLCLTTNGLPLSHITLLSFITNLHSIVLPSLDEMIRNTTDVRVDNVKFYNGVPYVLLYVEYEYGLENELYELLHKSYKGLM